MFSRSLFSVALVLATVPLVAQSSKPAPEPPKAASQTSKPAPQSKPSATRYVPAIMQPRTTLTGCLQYSQDYTLTNATVSQRGDVAQSAGGPGGASYRLEGLSPARLSLLVGKRVEVTGAFQDDPKAAAGSKFTPRFEATAVTEVTGTCS